MQPLRLAIITRHFWPHCGPVEAEVADVAVAIMKAGHPVRVLTIRWEKEWPSRCQLRELEVIRLGRSIGGPWGMFRYLRRLHREVRDSKLDGLIVYGLSDESWAIIRSYANSLPLVVRIDRTQLDQALTRPFNTRQLAILRKVNRLLVDSEATAERLREARLVDDHVITIVPPLVGLDPDFQRSLSRQNSVRRGLSDAHPILEIKPSQPLVVCATSQCFDRGMFDLVDAWSEVNKQYPFARLWILGGNRQTKKIWERISELDLADSIILPGWFDDLDDVFQAADIYVHPLRDDYDCAALNRARVAGLCTIATRQRANSVTIKLSENELVIPIQNPTALAESLLRAIESRDLRERCGRSARLEAIANFDVEARVAHFIEPFLASSTPTPTR